MKVPWLPRASIARMVDDVISGYETETGKRVTPPVPVEDIIEFGLGLRLAFEDLRTVAGAPFDVPRGRSDARRRPHTGPGRARARLES